MNLMESIGIIHSPKGKDKDLFLPHEIASRKSEPAAREETLTEETTLRKRRRVTFNPYQEKADFEKDEPTMRIRPLGETEPLQETSLSLTNESSDMSLDSTSSQSTSSSQTDSNDEESEEEEEVEGVVALPLNVDNDHQCSEIEEDDASQGDSAMNLTSAYGGSMYDDTGVTRRSDVEDSSSELPSSSPSIERGDDHTMTMQITQVFEDNESEEGLPEESHANSGEVDMSLDEEVSIENFLAHSNDSENEDSMDITTASGGIMDDADGEDKSEVSMDLTHISTRTSSRLSLSPKKTERADKKFLAESLTESTEDTPKKVPQGKKLDENTPERFPEPETLDETPKKSLKATRTSPRKSIQSSVQRQTQTRTVSRASMGNVNASKIASQGTSVRKSTGSISQSSSSKLPIASRNFTNLRDKTRPKPSDSRQSVSPRKGDNKSPVKTEELARSASPSPHRHSLHQQQLGSSPRLGHEYCKIPAAESPKQKLSAATMKALARKEQQASQTPVKPTRVSRGTSLGHHPHSPEKSPFRSSHPEPVKSHAGDPSSPRASASGPQHLSDTPRAVRRKSTKTNRSEDSEVAHPLQPRTSSPFRAPSTPSRVWQSFREQSPTTPRSPARRVAVQEPFEARQRTSTFGSPQRLTFSTPHGGEASHNDLLKRTDTASSGGDKIHEDGWTMKRFFDMLNLGFLDLSVPTRRKIQPEVDDSMKPRFDLVVKAACSTVPALDSLVDACRELKASVDDGRQMLMDNEKEFYENPPSYVAEVLAMTSAADRQKAISSFKLQKSAARAIALKAYYGWRTDKQFDDGALESLQEMEDNLKTDVTTVQERSIQVKEALPMLRQRSTQLIEELKLTRLRQKGITDWDGGEMQAMHSAMEEQSAVLEEQRAAKVEAEDQLARLQSRLAELHQKRAMAEDAIAQAYASAETISGSTQAEAARLARHVNQLESLHLWTLRKAQTNKIVMLLENAATLEMYLNANSKRVKRAHIHLRATETSAARIMACQVIQSSLDTQALDMSPAEIIRLATAIWTRARHINTVVDHLQIHVPVKTELCSNEDKSPMLQIIATLLLPHVQTKIELFLPSRGTSLLDSTAPLIARQDVHVQCIYGQSDVADHLLQNVLANLLHTPDIVTATQSAFFSMYR